MIGSLKPGMEADITILELISGMWRFEDSGRKTLEVTKMIVPWASIKSGQLIMCRQ
jgi:predicted amidohydrolase